MISIVMIIILTMIVVHNDYTLCQSADLRSEPSVFTGKVAERCNKCRIPFGERRKSAESRSETWISCGVAGGVDGNPDAARGASVPSSPPRMLAPKGPKSTPGKRERPPRFRQSLMAHHKWTFSTLQSRS